VKRGEKKKWWSLQTEEKIKRDRAMQHKIGGQQQEQQQQPAAGRAEQHQRLPLLLSLI
jgi:hypothetical protein